MQLPSPPENHASKRLIHRLDRIFAEINVVLLALAIGFAMLDLTCFTALRASTAIAQITVAAETEVPAQQWVPAAAPNRAPSDIR